MKASGKQARGFPGIALMMSLVVVVLLTAYISEFFFTSGLELRAMQTFKDGARARSLARLAFKATQVGLMMPEAKFFTQFAELQSVLSFSAIPWEEGFLIALEITPQDHLFNLNELAGLRDNSDLDKVRWNLFLATLRETPIVPIAEGPEPEPLPETRLAEIYAALVDWLDKGNEDYLGISGALGAEEGAYFDSEPRVSVKNAQLDRLTEIRLVRGLLDSRLPWNAWEDNFTVLPKSSGGLYPEKLNVNMATREEIVDFLEMRQLEESGLGEAPNRDAQKSINAYAENATAIAEVLVPTEVKRPRHKDMAALKSFLKAQLPDIKEKRADELFSLASEYYRITLTMNVAEVDARLRALVRVVRNPLGIGQQVEVLQFSLE